jgi:DNA-binding beta-propeller fold protein YncE
LQKQPKMSVASIKIHPALTVVLTRKHTVQCHLTLREPGMNRWRHSLRLTALIAAVVLLQLRCEPGSAQPADQQGPAGSAPTRTQHIGYIISQQSSTLMVLDTSTDTIIKKATHTDMVKPAWGRFHPSKKRFYAGGTGKVTIWNTEDVKNPTHVATVIPASGSTGEYRGFAIVGGTENAVDGEVWIANIQDSKVYVYTAASLEAPNPTLLATFTATDGLGAPHILQVRPGTNEVWLTNRPANTPGWIMRFDATRKAVIPTPSATLQPTGLSGDEPNEFLFSPDGNLVYLANHGPNNTSVVVINAATFVVKKVLPLIATAKAPGFVELDVAAGRAYFVSKWEPNLMVVDLATERVMRIIALGGNGVGYGVAATPDYKYLYVPLGVPEQSAVVVLDAKTLTIVNNILDTDLNGPRSVRFTRQ